MNIDFDYFQLGIQENFINERIFYVIGCAVWRIVLIQLIL